MRSLIPDLPSPITWVMPADLLRIVQLEWGGHRWKFETISRCTAPSNAWGIGSGCYLQEEISTLHDKAEIPPVFNSMFLRSASNSPGTKSCPKPLFRLKFTEEDHQFYPESMPRNCPHLELACLFTPCLQHIIVLVSRWWLHTSTYQ